MLAPPGMKSRFLGRQARNQLPTGPLLNYIIMSSIYLPQWYPPVEICFLVSGRYDLLFLSLLGLNNMKKHKVQISKHTRDTLHSLCVCRVTSAFTYLSPKTRSYVYMFLIFVYYKYTWLLFGTFSVVLGSLKHNVFGNTSVSKNSYSFMTL
jgi:hypothetical protein